MAQGEVFKIVDDSVIPSTKVQRNQRASFCQITGRREKKCSVVRNYSVWTLPREPNCPTSPHHPFFVFFPKAAEERRKKKKVGFMKRIKFFSLSYFFPMPPLILPFVSTVETDKIHGKKRLAGKVLDLLPFNPTSLSRG